MEQYFHYESKPARRFNSEAEYRLWQHQLAVESRPVRFFNGVGSLVASVRRLLSRANRTEDEMARPVAGKHQTQTMARVTESRAGRGALVRRAARS